MYSAHFGFRENPFRRISDPLQVHYTAAFERALDTLLEGARSEAGVILLCGHAGTGKTLLLGELRARLEPHTSLATISYTRLDHPQFISTCCEACDLETAGSTRQQTARLRSYLKQQRGAGTPAVVLIDEADALSDEILASLTSLLHIGAGRQPLARIVLAVQPGFERRLQLPQVRALAAAITLRVNLDPLPPEEVAPYIAGRLHAAGHAGGKLFTAEAIERIAGSSEGIPQRINVLCGAALWMASERGLMTVPGEIVESVLQDLSAAAPEEAIPGGASARPARSVTSGAETGPSVAEHEREGTLLRVVSQANSLLRSVAARGWPQAQQLASRMFSRLRRLATRVHLARRTWPMRRPSHARQRAARSPTANVSAEWQARENRRALYLQIGFSVTLGILVVLVWTAVYTGATSTEPASPTPSTAARNDAGKLRATLDQVLEQNTKLHGALAAANEAQDNLKSRIAQLQAAQRRLSDELHDAREALGASKETIDHQREKIDALRAQVSDVALTRREPLPMDTGAVPTAQRAVPLERHAPSIALVSTDDQGDPKATTDHAADREAAPTASPKEPDLPTHRAAEAAPTASKPRAQSKPQSSGPSGPTTSYVVAAGDTLSGIARRYGVTVAQVARRNGLARRDVLRPGQRLLLPVRGPRTPRADAVALLHAAAAGNLQAVRELLAHDVSPDARGDDGRTALMAAARAGDADMVAFLLEHKANPDARSDIGGTALMDAAWRGHIGTLQALLARHAAVNARNHDGWTALMYASIQGHPAAVRLLLEHGADADAKTVDGRTALAAATWNGHAQVVRALLDAHARVGVKSNDGWTPLMYGAWNGNLEIVRMLVAQGADTNEKNKQGQTALTLAKKQGHTKMVEFLERLVVGRRERQNSPANTRL